MGLIDSIKGGVSRAIWKGVKHVGTAIAGVGATFLLNKLHFQLSEDHQLAVAVAITGLFGTGLKMLKDRFPNQLGWL